MAARRVVVHDAIFIFIFVCLFFLFFGRSLQSYVFCGLTAHLEPLTTTVSVRSFSLVIYRHRGEPPLGQTEKNNITKYANYNNTTI